MIFRRAISTVGLVFGLAVFLRLTVFTSLVMSGSAMTPTILPGEFLLATYGSMTNPPRGAVVLYRCPPPSDRTCLKRVVGIAGDRIEDRPTADGGDLLVNDVRVGPSPSRTGTPSIVPVDSVFVMNDRREDFDDSRSTGPVATDVLTGRARVIWLSLDWFEDDGRVRSIPRVRWDRLGRWIR